MKTISKLIITLMFFAAATVTNAQFKAGFRVGGNLSNIITDDEDFKEIRDEKIGFHGGIIAEYMFSSSLGIQTAILYSEKGSKITFEEDEGDIEEGHYNYKVFATPKLGYLEMPLHAVFKLPLGTASRLTISAGPYIAYGVTEAIKVNYTLKTTGNIEADTKTEMKGYLDEMTKNLQAVADEYFVLFKEDGVLTPFDFGAGMAVGYELHKFEAKVGMDMGLKNIYRETEEMSLKNRNIYLSVGFKF